jgi:hypothetical protein
MHYILYSRVYKSIRMTQSAILHIAQTGQPQVYISDVTIVLAFALIPPQ